MQVVQAVVKVTLRSFTPAQNAGVQDDKFRSSNGYIVVREGSGCVQHRSYFLLSDK